MMTQIEENFYRIAIDRMREDKHLDWEQRRYEIARDIFSKKVSSHSVTAGATIESWASTAVNSADCLIKYLKKRNTL